MSSAGAWGRPANRYGSPKSGLAGPPVGRTFDDGIPRRVAYDANINAGIPPIETRARYDENLSFVLKAWTVREPFAWNGKYSQYMSVNVWPRPFQTPHPPVSVTGTGNPNTTRFALQRDFGFNLIVMGRRVSRSTHL